MKKRTLVYIGAILVVILYIFFINTLAYSFYSDENVAIKSYEGGADVRVGVSDNVGVSVTRPRFYGTITESSSSNSKISFLYLFNIIKLPLESGAINFLWIHIPFLIIGIFIFIFSLRRIRRNEFEMGFM